MKLCKWFSGVVAKVTCLSLSICSGVASAQAPSSQPPTLKPLDAILSEFRAELDFTKASYLFKRCAGYSFATAKLLNTSGGDSLKERSVEWHKGGMNAVSYAVDTEMSIQNSRSPNSRKSKDQWTQETVGIAIEFGNIYIERMSANYLRSGNYVFDDPWLTSEHEICREPSKRLAEALR